MDHSESYSTAPPKKANNNNNNKNNKNNNNNKNGNKKGPNKQQQQQQKQKQQQQEKGSLRKKGNLYKSIKEEQVNKKKNREIALKQYHEEIKELNKRIKDEAPARGSNPLANKVNDDKKNEEYKISYSAASKFNQLPISKLTMKGLDEKKYIDMTDIQRSSIPHSLCGRDILGAAKTGSGKTLAFIVPMLELLYRNSWNIEDGVGAIILSPTRELAIQIFDVLRDAGKYHSFSAGLIIGGKNVDNEKKKINEMNILIATPGRLLQHMDETEGFRCNNLQMLILDEADRILDFGFTKTLNSIVQNLPSSRQTLLFSATQTKSVKDLARLSLREPEYVSVYDRDLMSTPANLTQTVMFSTLEDKINLLYSFLHSHLTKKTIVFLTTCKQVRFIYETFYLINPGCRLFQLHGKMKQTSRLDVFQQFCDEKMGTLFATDVAARGLDFPTVDWVIQMDCPDDIATYIHRVGRTARNNTEGNSLTVLLPTEKPFIKLMEKQNIHHQILETNPEKSINIQPKLAAILSEKVDLKYLAQKAFITYVKSIYRQDNKEVFSLEGLDLKAFSNSMGLPGAPNIQIGKTLKTDKNNSYKLTELQKKQYEKKLEKEKKAKELEERGEELVEDEDNLSEDEKEVPKISKYNVSRVERLFKRKNPNVFSEEFDKLRDKMDEEDDVFVMKRKDHTLEDVQEEIEENDKTTELNRRQQNRLVKIQNRIINPEVKSKIQLDEANEFVGQDHQLPQDYIEEMKSRMEQVDPEDKEVHKQKLRDRRQRKLLKLKEKERPQGKDQEDGQDGEKGGAYFVPQSDEEEYEYIDDGEEYQPSDNDSDGDSSESSYEYTYDGEEYKPSDDEESESEEEEEEPVKPTKKNIKSIKSTPQPKPVLGKRSIDEQEEAALQILKRRK
ncbi:putative RNA helicase [Cavenderia fasciculata]|uniref:ATP-dependent RNA helicase n=1 Tax=Cavenderia fasciculata TaxID=261658 RepID=F4PZR3_CACFS|nr:putative RNA helicase [Cavenderia fasciculata]EGG18827.1 putative RNA helicase [Cavenderia fasciculata]|eukprot:XP_004357289.1 putative RNA helicase [Cavenderia fasciculata]